MKLYEKDLTTQVEVKLTPYGKQIWRNYYTDLNLNPSDFKFNFKERDKDVLECPLWELMKIFGKCFSFSVMLSSSAANMPFVGGINLK